MSLSPIEPRRVVRVVLSALAAVALGACLEQQPPVSGQRAALGAGCGPLGYLGCCDGDTLRYCAPGGDGGPHAVSRVCSQGCGWSSVFGLYACGGALVQDPGGLARACPPLDAGGGDAGGGDHGGEASVGPRDRGADAPSADASTCGSIDYVGCCAGTSLLYCVGQTVLTLDCGAKADCGWNATQGFYGCGTSGGADPSGAHPRACQAGSPDAGLTADRGSADARALETGVVDAKSGDAPRFDGGVDGPTADQAQDVSPADQASDRSTGLEVSGFDSSPDARSELNFGSGGCSCRVARQAPPHWLLSLLLLAAVRRRRRSF